jgi:glycosyltransferase involved in cell wall biosynthesis
MSLVSVIMPTHNAEKWVADTIDTVIAQTYPHVELIVVDDGSQDDTVSLIRQKLANDFCKTWKIMELGTNRGPSAARNAGLRAANGAWVQFLDSDDFMAPTKLERQMAHCATASSDVATVHSPWQLCYFDAGKITWVGSMAEPKKEIKAPIMCLVGANRPLHPAGITRRSVLDQIGGFDESLRFWECEEINVRIATVGRIELLPSSEPYYLWRLHRGKVYIGGNDARYRLMPVAFGWIEQVSKAAQHRLLDQLELCDADRMELLDQCTMWARLLYSQNRPAFRKYVALARQLVPDIKPTNPRYVSLASRFVGYENAEAIAKVLGIPRTFARKALQRLELHPQDALFDRS